VIFTRLLWHRPHCKDGKNTVTPDLCRLDLPPSALAVFAARPNTINQAHKLVWTVLKMLSCWTPMVTISCSIILFKLTSKLPLKKLRTLSLRKGLMILMVTEVHQGVQGHWFKQVVSSSKTRNYKDACYEKIVKEKKRFCPTRLLCFVSSSHLQGHVHCHLYCWTMQMMIQMTCLLKLSPVIL
jgi:hypothetical protein